MLIRLTIKPRLVLIGLLAFVVLLPLTLVILDNVFPLKSPFAQQGTRQFATTVLDSQGRPLRAFADNKGIWRHRVELAQVSPLYLQALLSYEDQYFYQHFGINPLAIVRAMWLNITNGRMVSGGSTLTMQVARLLHPHSRTIAGKLYQMLRALQLEWHYSKDQILTLYINLAPFGGTIEGVQAASFSYLDKNVSDLTHAEAALLAVLPQAPTRYRPDLRPQKARQARDKVLERMVSQGVWSGEVVDDAKIEQVDQYRAARPILAPLLARRLKPLAQNDNKKGTITTTIDGNWQQGLEGMLKRYAKQLPQGASGAVLVIDNNTAAVKAYLGSADFKDNSRFGHVDMISAIRSPGSTLKPFLFAFALEQGLIHSHSLLADVPLVNGQYRPANFSGGFSGPVTASEALQRSLNIPFVTLLTHLGPAWFDGRLKGAGLTLKLKNDDTTNLAMILGGAGASLEQLVGAFAGFANHGQALQLKWLKSQLQSAPHQRYLTSKEAAWVTYQTLSQIDRPGSINSASSVSRQHGIAWKTGTSYGFRDSWAIGSNKNYTVGVWLGRPDNSPMPGYFGRKTAGPLLFSVFNFIDPNGRSPKQPDNVTQGVICWPLGTELSLPLYQEDPQLCHQQHTAWLVDDTAPVTLHDAHRSKLGLNPMPYWLNLDNGLRLGPHCGGERFANKALKHVALWPASVMAWIKPAWRTANLLPKPDPNCQGEAFSMGQGLSIKGIADGSILRYQGGQLPQLKLQAIGATARQHWYINGAYYKSIDYSQHLNYQFDATGDYQFLVMDDSGEVAKVAVSVWAGK